MGFDEDPLLRLFACACRAMALPYRRIHSYALILMMQPIIDVFDYLILESYEAAVVAPPIFAREIRLIESQHLDMSGKPEKLVMEDPVCATRGKYFYWNDNCRDLVSICPGPQFYSFLFMFLFATPNVSIAAAGTPSFRSAW
jgi:hypothetical protein